MSTFFEIGEIMTTDEGINLRYVGDDDGDCPGLALEDNGRVWWGDPLYGLSPTDYRIVSPELPRDGESVEDWDAWRAECMERVHAEMER